MTRPTKVTSATLHLKPGREKALLQNHPWIFSGAVSKVEGEPGIGETVAVQSASGQFLGWAAYSPHSQIRARLWNRGDRPVDAGFIRDQLRRAISMREFWVPPGTTAMRLVHAESDGLPGLVVDRYAEWLVVQFLSAGAEYWRDDIISILMELTEVKQIYERSDVDVRKFEGLLPTAGVLVGKAPAGPIQVSENGLNFWIDFQHGQKTGFYIDQRHNREQVGVLCDQRRVLNCFSYTGGFSVYALAGGADHVISVDSSAPALATLTENIKLNNLPMDRSQVVEGDVFKVMRQYRDEGHLFDLIVLDPPKFAQTSSQAQRAARAYKDINLLGFELLRPGGILASFSCSGGISADLFQKIVAGAAADASVDAKIVLTMTQGADHPVSLNFPEGAYLKGLVCYVSGKRT